MLYFKIVRRKSIVNKNSTISEFFLGFGKKSFIQIRQKKMYETIVIHFSSLLVCVH